MSQGQLQQLTASTRDLQLVGPSCCSHFGQNIVMKHVQTILLLSKQCSERMRSNKPRRRPTFACPSWSFIIFTAWCYA